MRLGWLKAVVLVIAAIMLSIVAGQGQAQETQGEQPEGCPFEEGWKPENLPRILEEHRKWAARLAENQYSEEWTKNHPEGRANLCNANLFRADLSKADLSLANLSKANLTKAKLFRTKLFLANLTKADLKGANLTEADLRAANLTEAEAYVDSANLTKVNLSLANLTKAKLFRANLTKAKLFRANLTEANLGGADLSKADLAAANLTEAGLIRANLSNADLTGANLTEASLTRANLTNAVYAPASPPPDPYLEGVRGLSTVQFPKGSGSGLVQFRELLQKAGLRDLEREATYALESNKTTHLITGEQKNPLNSLKGVFRLAAFEWTTGYGLYPGRARACSVDHIRVRSVAHPGLCLADPLSSSLSEPGQWHLSDLAKRPH